MRSVWAAGRDTFYDGVVQIAGGVNAVEEGLARYPELSREGLASLDADVVLGCHRWARGSKPRPGRRACGMDAADRAAGGPRAQRINVLAGDQMVVPGPRLPEMVEAMARALHPELEWGTE